MLRGHLILRRFVAVIVISILASLFWNTLYVKTVVQRPNILSHMSLSAEDEFPLIYQYSTDAFSLVVHS